MADLTTTYMGLKLKNPLIVASCGLSGSLSCVRQCAAAGAGAIVLKSLFEEQIAAAAQALSPSAELDPYGEAAEYIEQYGMALGPHDYLKLVKEAKASVDVPIIPSLNCVSSRRWSDYACQLEDAGADALELNVALMPTDARQEGAAVEEIFYRILHDVKKQVGIPVAMKVGPFFSNFVHFAEQLTRDRAEAPPFMVGWCGPGETRAKIVWSGADALVLFNRFYQLDIDLDRLRLVAGNPYSSSAEIHTALRLISLLAGRIEGDLAATTGIHSGADIAKQLLAGATVVQVCSALYQHGLGRITAMLAELEDWMAAHDFATLDEFRGRLSQQRSAEPAGHERLQYIKLFSSDHL
ncbi:MAG: dihydroorotate dehydrogenase-like protein [Desulfuromonadaceae bacterium]|nr:dihydroorotate dehydrogenase-like protein [Desulfuromonadaceae bacterium]